MRNSAVISLSVCLLSAATTISAAQTVRGALIERISGNHVSGAFVVLVDRAGTEVARALTAQNGAFTVRAPSAGVYHLISRRVGFQPGRSPPLELGPGSIVTHRLEIEPIPVALPTLIVEGERQCDLRSDRGAASIAALWQEIREVLTSVVWSTREPGYWFRYSTYERELTAGRRVVRETNVSRHGWYLSPFASAPTGELTKHGYVIADGDQWVFFAPDAEVLLSDAFLEGHCFEVRIGKRDNAGLIGLRFEPAPNNDLPEITGTLWVARESSELRHLEYTYTRTPGPLRDLRSGGRISFRRVPSGAWIVDDWIIRMPVGGVSNRPGSPFTREVGGRVEMVKRGDGTTIHTRDVALVYGTVFDSVRGTPLAHAEVFITGTSYSSRTDTAGAFHMEVPLDGLYALSFAHPRLDSLGFQAEPTEVQVQPGAGSVVRLAVPSDRSLVGRLCPDTTVAATERVVVGGVRESHSHRPAAGARVELTWQEVRGTGSGLVAREWQASGNADDRGSYLVCALPVDRTITFRSIWGSHEGIPVSLRFSEHEVRVSGGGVKPLWGRIWRQDLQILTDMDSMIIRRRNSAIALATDSLAKDSALSALHAVGFYERRRTSLGYFVTRDDFMRWSAASTTAVLARIPGLITIVRGGRRFIDVRRGRSSIRFSCTPAVVLDNNPIGFTGELDLDAVVPVEQLAGIEVYRGPSEVPSQFGGTNTACGLIAFWTR